MSKIVFIYSEKDYAIEFLSPLCNHICDTLSATRVGYDKDNDDDTLSEIYNIAKDADIIFFLGHGRSDALYADLLDDCNMFDKYNIDLLQGKKLFLLACNSADFIHRYHLTSTIGFQDLPTSLYDAQKRKHIHGIDITDFSQSDIDIYNKALVDALCNSISVETINDYSLFRERFKFQVSREIVKCLIQHKDKENYRKIADVLFYLQKDMIIK